METKLYVRSSMRVWLVLSWLALAGAHSQARARTALHLDEIPVAPPGHLPSATANGMSDVLVLHPDGLQLAFASSADDLDPVTVRHQGLDVYYLPRRGAAAQNITGALRPGNHGSSVPVGFARNQLLFASDANDLDPGVTKGIRQLFAYDLATKTRRLLSRYDADGTPSQASVSGAFISQNGRYVFFESSSGLTGKAENGAVQIYRCDLQNDGRLLLVSTDSDGSSPSVYNCVAGSASADGERVSYSVKIPSGSPPGTPALAVRDLFGGTSRVYELPPPRDVKEGEIADFGGIEMSANGTSLAAWQSSNISSGVVWYDLVTKTNAWCYLQNPLLGRSLLQSSSITLFPDGKTLAFEAQLTDTGSVRVLFWNPERGLFDFDGFGGNPPSSWSLALSPDARQVAYLSDATNVVAGTESSATRLYIRTLSTGETVAVSAQPGGISKTFTLDTGFFFNSDGSELLVSTATDGLVEGDMNGSSDLFAVGPHGNVVEVLSKSNGRGVRVGREQYFLSANSINSDGNVVAFTSSSGLLKEGNGMANVFVHDRRSHQTRRISHGTAPDDSTDGLSWDGRISPDGSKVLFLSTDPSILTTGNSSLPHAYVLDVEGHTFKQVDMGGEAAPDLQTVVSADLSPDGKKVFFETSERSTTRKLFISDLDAGTPILLDDLFFSPYLVRFSRDGKWAVSASSAVLKLFSVQEGVKSSQWILTNAPGRIENLWISGHADRAVAYVRHSPPWLYYLDLASNQVRGPIVAQGVSNIYAGALAGNGDFLVLEASDPRGMADAPFRQLFSIRMTNGFVTPITTNVIGQWAGGSSQAALLSPDGRWLVFESNAPDLLPGEPVGQNNVYRRNMISGEISLVSRAADGRPSSGSFQPRLSGDGSTILFASRDSHLAGPGVGLFTGLYLAQFVGPQLRITPAITGGVASLTWDTDAGTRYQLQTRAGFDSGDWLNAGSPLEGDGGDLETGVIPVGGKTGFFRVLELP